MPGNPGTDLMILGEAAQEFGVKTTTKKISSTKKLRMFPIVSLFSIWKLGSGTTSVCCYTKEKLQQMSKSYRYADNWCIYYCENNKRGVQNQKHQ